MANFYHTAGCYGYQFAGFTGVADAVSAEKMNNFCYKKEIH
jgi:hypothetical protein